MVHQSPILDPAFGAPLKISPPKWENIVSGHYSAIVQISTPIGSTVAEI